MQLKHINKAHRQNAEAAMKYIADSKKRIINWEEEIERQKRNSKDV
jgi:hypothetical protein